jgi:tetratricopeptide (TPR) repeat protein
MPRKKKVKILLPYCNKCLAACLAGVLLLTGCSSTPTRTDDTAKPATEPVKLPGDYDKALVLMQSGDYKAAIPVLLAFIDQRPELAGPYINLGIAYQQTGDTENASKALQKAIALNPANAAAHLQLGILHREQGNFEAALSAYSTALNLNNDYALAHRNIGILYDLYMQQPARALDHYKKYLELASEPDQNVTRWVVDLERRSGSSQARAAQ